MGLASPNYAAELHQHTPTALISIARLSFVFACLVISCFCLIALPSSWPGLSRIVSSSVVLLTWLVLITRQSFALVVLPLLLPRQDPHTRPESRLLTSISPKPGREGSALRHKVQGKGNVGLGSFSWRNLRRCFSTCPMFLSLTLTTVKLGRLADHEGMLAWICSQEYHNHQDQSRAQARW